MKLWHIQRSYNDLAARPCESFHNADDALSTWAMYTRDPRYTLTHDDDGTPVLVEALSRGEARYWLQAPTERELDDAAARLLRIYQGNGQSDETALADAADWYGYQRSRRLFWLATCGVQAQRERVAA